MRLLPIPPLPRCYPCPCDSPGSPQPVAPARPNRQDTDGRPALRASSCTARYRSRHWAVASMAEVERAGDLAEPPENSLQQRLDMVELRFQHRWIFRRWRGRMAGRTDRDGRTDLIRP